MTRRHKAYSYLRAFAAQFLGYHRLHLLDDVRMKRKRIFGTSARKAEQWKKKRRRRQGAEASLDRMRG